MKFIFNPLYSDLERQLLRLHSESDALLFVSEQALVVITKCLEKIKDALRHYRFENDADEIDFFRNHKPLLTSKLLYYNTVFLIESCKPVGDKKAVKAYYRAELQKLQRFFNDNVEFYRYYRSGNGNLDALYFRRGVTPVPPFHESLLFDYDADLCTSHDYKVACILANDQLQLYLETAVNQLCQNSSDTVAPVKWTGPKIGLVELIYALHTEGVFNHGDVMLKDICKSLEIAFQIQLGHVPRQFIELRERKTAPTRFLDSLTEKLRYRMTEADR